MTKRKRPTTTERAKSSTQPAQRRPIVMVSSTVYGIEDFLDMTHILLNGMGYEVWMSHKGTMPVDPKLSNFDNCVRCVRDCDLFLGIITPQYGSGVGKKPGDISITHREIREAISQKKPRWILAHDHVVFARAFLNRLQLNGKSARSRLTLESNMVLSDLRCIELYEEVAQVTTPLPNRVGNWAQTFRSSDDARLFVLAQFDRYLEAHAFLKDNFPRPSQTPRITL